MSFFTIILFIIVLAIGLIVSFVVGEMVTSTSKKAETVHPFFRVIGSIAIGVFLLYSLFEIIRISGCKTIPY